jgi:hypothetical protein
LWRFGTGLVNPFLESFFSAWVGPFFGDCDLLVLPDYFTMMGVEIDLDRL